MQEAGVNAGHTFKGIVHSIRSEQVYVHFHTNFQAIGKTFNVRFQLNRTALRRQHQALAATIPHPERLLFPEDGHEGLDAPIGPDDAQIGLFNTTLSDNVVQRQAVKSIMELKFGSAPFIVYGP